MATVLVNNKTVALYVCKNIRFMPGMNRIEEKDLALLKTHQNFRKKVELGWLEIDETKPFEEVQASVNQMKSVIKETYDVQELRKIIENDNRESIKKSAQAQIDKINSMATANGDENADINTPNE